MTFRCGVTFLTYRFDSPNLQVSTAYAAEIVESADAYLVAGPTFNDYTTCGWTLLLKSEKVSVSWKGAELLAAHASDTACTAVCEHGRRQAFPPSDIAPRV